MATATANKAVTYFLAPETIRAVKIEAARSDKTQSEIVETALAMFLTDPEPTGKPPQGSRKPVVNG